MWLERTRVQREAEFVQSNLRDIMKVAPLMSPRQRLQKVSYDSCVASMYATRHGGKAFNDWAHAHELDQPDRFTIRQAPKIPLLRQAQAQRAQSARGRRPAAAIPLELRTPGATQVPALHAPKLLFDIRRQGVQVQTSQAPTTAKARREAKLALTSMYRDAPMLDQKFMHWWVNEDEDDFNDENQPVGEHEMGAAKRIIAKKLTARGFADYDRVRAHFRRCDDWKGYLNGRVTVDDAHGVLASLSLKTIRKPTWNAIINKFQRQPHEVGDVEYCIKYIDLCEWLIADAERPTGFGEAFKPVA